MKSNTSPQSSRLPSSSSSAIANWPRRKRRNDENPRQPQQRTWAKALTLAAFLASQDNMLCAVNAFQPIHNNARQLPRPQSAPSNTPPLPPSSSRFFASSSALDETLAKPGLQCGHKRSASATSTTMTLQMPSSMFLTAAQASNQPMSALSSNFFDSSPSTTTSFQQSEDDKKLSEDLYYQTAAARRSRGVLGFCLPDHGDHVISSSKTPPPVEESTTCLHSSTERETPSASFSPSSSSPSSSFGRDYETWSFPDSLDSEEEWLSLSDNKKTNISTRERKNNENNSNHNNPVLNRSPNANRKEWSTQAPSSDEDSLAWFPWMPSISQIEALKVRELRKICSDRGLKQVRLDILCLLVVLFSLFKVD